MDTSCMSLKHVKVDVIVCQYATYACGALAQIHTQYKISVPNKLEKVHYKACFAVTGKTLQ